jgi:hypothetical protein
MFGSILFVTKCGNPILLSLPEINVDFTCNTICVFGICVFCNDIINAMFCCFLLLIEALISLQSLAYAFYRNRSRLPGCSFTIHFNGA